MRNRTEPSAGSANRAKWMSPYMFMPMWKTPKWTKQALSKR